MHIVLSPETQKLLEERMLTGRFATADEAVRAALQTLGGVEGDLLEEFDPDTRAAIVRADAQAERGEDRPWEDVREELRGRYLHPH
jgi:Arc/MetJ-type ribon-helix-helix transcriptional regulator